MAKPNEGPGAGKKWSEAEIARGCKISGLNMGSIWINREYVATLFVVTLSSLPRYPS